MDIKIPFVFTGNFRNLLRRGGYSEHQDINSGKTSYTRRLTRDYYPRFHIYFNQHDGQNYLSLHLDQKKPSYAGSHAHNAEYDGSLVEKESIRVQGLIKNELDNQAQTKAETKKSFFTKLFSH